MNSISKSELISIIVLNYNGVEYLKKCLASILHQDYPNIEIILVDNASTDNSVNFVSSTFPQVKIIRNKRGLGFGGGNLVGVKAAKGNKILLVSNDTWMKPDLLTKLNGFYDKNSFNVVAPYQADYESKSTYLNTSLIDPFGHHIYIDNTETPPFYLTGVCLFCRKDFYLKTRGMDPKFFLYVEDADWFWRLLLLGYTFTYVPHSYIYHKGGGSTGGHNTKKLKADIFLYRNRNTLYMLLKNYSLPSLFIILPLYIVINVFEVIFFTILLKIHIVKAYVISWVQIYSRLNEIRKERIWVQKNRVVSDVEIIKKMYKGSAKLAHLTQFYAK